MQKTDGDKNEANNETDEGKEDIEEIFEKHRLKKLKAYENFNHKKDNFLDEFEFSWDIHGYDLFTKFLPITTKLVSSQFNLAFRMTRRSFADKPQRVDTSDFRNAIIYYLKEIHGIRDETFKYKKINDLMNIEQKIYIKKIMCKPQDITIKDYYGFSEMLKDSEKCHVCILAMETKKQVSMIYVARALSEFLS